MGNKEEYESSTFREQGKIVEDFDKSIEQQKRKEKDDTSVEFGKLSKTDSQRPIVKNKIGVNVRTPCEQSERKFLAHSDGSEQLESAASQRNKTKSDAFFVETINGLEKTVRELEIENVFLKKNVRKFIAKSEQVEREYDALQNKLKESEEELRNVLEEFGRVSFENEQKAKERRRKETFDKLFKSNVGDSRSPSAEAAPLLQHDGASTSAAPIQSPDVEASGNVEIKPEVAVVEEIPENDAVREESSNREGVSLTYIPSTAVEKSIYNNYKLLLLVISDMLLSGEVVKFQEWTRDVFRVDLSAYVYDGFLELDRKGIISASDLTKLREFFETLSRIDLVHLIDCFLQGDYAYLQRSVRSRKNNNPSRNTRTAAIVATTSIPNPKRPLAVGLLGGARNPGSSQGDEGEESFAGGRAEVQNSQFKSRSSLGNCRTHIEGAFGTNVHRAGQVVADGVAHDKYDRPSVSRSEAGGRKPSQLSTTQWREPQVDMGSNGNKLSKFAREDSSRNRNPQNSDDDDDSDVEDENWLCNHYKRRCHVKFACCDKYWPCHRCHNNESDCGTKKLKSIHTKFVKCVKCGQEQEFGDGSQYCTQCHTKFASYFCAICKHLTGKDDKPYHCEQCGICRIHKHRSFHCDICGVCLDVQLRDNHKCRAGSAHDECCICLEDAFTGCQILPCSHKVHKECASQMIRNGITRCPICRESFAHKLEKRPSNSPRKHHFDSKMPFQK